MWRVMRCSGSPKASILRLRITSAKRSNLTALRMGDVLIWGIFGDLVPRIGAGFLKVPS